MAAIFNFGDFSKMQFIAIQAHTLALAILLATFCAFEWRSNLKIDRVMVILQFDLRFHLVTYLFDLWPHNNNISLCGTIFHMWTTIGDD